MKYLVYIALPLLFLLQKCSQPNEEFVVLDLDESLSSKSLKLSDVASNLRLVALETSEESFLPERFDYLVGAKYIITYSRNRVKQFRSDGAFVRALANRGKGPGEFNYVSAMVMDNAEEVLYLSHHGSDELLTFDLINGNQKEAVSIPEKAMGMVFSGEQELLLYCYGFGDYKRYKLDVTDGSISEEVKTSEDHPTGTGIRRTVISKVRDDIYCLFTESDTLYKYVKGSYVPELFIKYGNQVDMSKTSKGRQMIFSLNGIGHLLVGLQDLNVVHEENGSVHINSGEDQRIFGFDKADQKLWEISEFKNDLVKVEIESVNTLQQHGGFVSIRYDAVEIVEQMEEQPALKDFYSNLLDGIELKEDDNPVLVIGEVL